MSTYLKTFYSEKEKAYSTYPLELTDYLTKKFDLSKGECSLLDLGCGRGEFINAFGLSLSKLCHGIFIRPNIEGFDKEIDGAFHSLVNKLTEGDFNHKLPYKDNSFNIVFAKSVIEHSYHPENMVAEAYRVLKPGGKFIVMTPDWGYHYKSFYEDFTHKTPFIRSSLEKILKMHDFKVEYCERFRQLPFIWDYPILNIISSIAQLFYHSETKNKLIKFSKEVMLLAVGVK